MWRASDGEGAVTALLVGIVTEGKVTLAGFAGRWRVDVTSASHSTRLDDAQHDAR